MLSVANREREREREAKRRRESRIKVFTFVSRVDATKYFDCSVERDIFKMCANTFFFAE